MTEDKRRAPIPAFRPGEPLLSELDARGGGIPALRAALTAHFDALREELQHVNLTEQEALLIVEALDGGLETHPPTFVWLLWSRVMDAVDRRGMGRSVDVPALVAKLRRLRYSELLAIIDAAHRLRVTGGDVWTVGLAKLGEQEPPC